MTDLYGLAKPVLGAVLAAAPVLREAPASTLPASSEDAEPLVPTRPELPSEAQIFALVYRQMRALTAGQAIADFEDLVQIAAEQALKSLPSFEGRSRLSTWVFGICYRTWSKQCRFWQRWLRRFALTRDGEIPEPGEAAADPACELEHAEALQRMRAAIARLSIKRRTVVILHDLEELPVEEIALVLELKVNTVRSRLRDGRRDLALLLRDDPYFGDRACSTEEAPR